MFMLASRAKRLAERNLISSIRKHTQQVLAHFAVSVRTIVGNTTKHTHRWDTPKPERPLHVLRARKPGVRYWIICSVGPDALSALDVDTNTFETEDSDFVCTRKGRGNCGNLNVASVLTASFNNAEHALLHNRSVL